MAGLGPSKLDALRRAFTLPEEANEVSRKEANDFAKANASKANEAWKEVLAAAFAATKAAAKAKASVARAAGDRFLLVVIPNSIVPGKRRNVDCTAPDLESLLTGVKQSVGVSGEDIVLSLVVTAKDGFHHEEPLAVKSLDEVGTRAKVQLWPASHFDSAVVAERAIERARSAAIRGLHLARAAEEPVAARPELARAGAKQGARSVRAREVFGGDDTDSDNDEVPRAEEGEAAADEVEAEAAVEVKAELAPAMEPAIKWEPSDSRRQQRRHQQQQQRPTCVRSAKRHAVLARGGRNTKYGH